VYSIHKLCEKPFKQKDFGQYIYKPKINTLHASEYTQDIEKNRVIARIQKGKLDILKKITEKLTKKD
jgi:hypothetical protein